MGTVLFNNARSIEDYLNPEFQALFVYDKSYCDRGCVPDHMNFTKDENGFLVTDYNGVPLRIAMIGCAWKGSNTIACRRILDFSSVSEYDVYSVSDRTSLWLYRNEMMAIKRFQKQLGQLTYPFGEQSYSEISLWKTKIED